MMQTFIRYLLVFIATLPVVGGQACAASMGETVVNNPAKQAEASLKSSATEASLLVFKQAFLNEVSSEEEVVVHVTGFDSPLGQPTHTFFSGLSFTQWPSATAQVSGTGTDTTAQLPLYLRYHNQRL
ncbi:hypothetical protein [Rufibacter hautae]|uniref:Uncharacterized protein n=1 Tax=Rufibacter hautae TaxID=2595005 RepID=A0A5B6TBE3_9BACT|nr:hypothetical protein [Rufibacter hautae]KAA3436334.1 hypothetical protein FOA19_18225 [Rufibacter hautae]